jgi:alpha/beta superfamily hydrolase
MPPASISPRHNAACSFNGPSGNIEALLDDPDTAPAAIAVVCHPHPLQGGAMQNKVTYMLARAFNDLGALSLRFNFRGVGQSAGNFDNGMGETDDALAAIDWLTAQHPGLPLWLGGFSFGSFVALRAQSRRQVARLVTVAPAVERFASDDIVPPASQWILVQGMADDVVSPQAVLAWARSLPKPPHIIEMAGAGHFFHGRLNELREAVATAFRS